MVISYMIIDFNQEYIIIYIYIYTVLFDRCGGHCVSSIFAMPAMQDQNPLAPLLSESEALEKQADQVAESIAKGEDDNGDVLKATNHACMDACMHAIHACMQTWLYVHSIVSNIVLPQQKTNIYI